MRNIRSIAILLIGAFFLYAGHAHAESIKTFNTAITVRTDNSVLVYEIITYDTEGLQKHGILRTIRTVSSNGKGMDISDIVVTDALGNPYQFDVQRNGSDLTLKIGDPSYTFTGERTYRIQYVATNAVAHLQDRDEIYWNATGNNWPFPIVDASATISLPGDAPVTASACYVGASGSTEPCRTNGKTMFDAGRTLNAGEGFTVAAGFPQGIVAPYAPESWWHRYGMIVLAILLPLLVFAVLYVRWRLYGRDPKGTGVIVPQYDVPESLTPMEVGIIVREKSAPKDISAEIIYLATKGYIKIRQIDKTVLKLFHSTDYEFVLLKSYVDLTDQVDQKLLSRLFSSPAVGTAVTLSSLQNEFYTAIPPMFKLLRQTMLDKQYYKNLPGSGKSNRGVWQAIIWVIIVFGFGSSMFNALISVVSANVRERDLIFFAGSIVLSVILVAVFNALMPAKTEKGVATKEYILGLKEYLQIAEKDRLQFHNAPEKKPEVFEQLLPYALVLGVENSWAKEFEGMYAVPPSWYEGSYNGTFNAIVFTHALGGFSNSAMTTLGSAPGGGSGGSGGGGFSGGGGGGGGGGSW